MFISSCPSLTLSIPFYASCCTVVCFEYCRLKIGHACNFSHLLNIMTRFLLGNLKFHIFKEIKW